MRSKDVRSLPRTDYFTPPPPGESRLAQAQFIKNSTRQTFYAKYRNNDSPKGESSLQ